MKKPKFRIREEIFSENGEKSRFYCEHKFLWWWLPVFDPEELDGSWADYVFLAAKFICLSILESKPKFMPKVSVPNRVEDGIPNVDTPPTVGSFGVTEKTQNFIREACQDM